MLVRYINDLHLSSEIVTAVPLQNKFHCSLRNISISLSAFHNRCTITERHVSLRLAGFRRMVLNPYPGNNASWVSTDQNDFLLAFNLYPSNYANIEIWGFLGRDWFQSYVINRQFQPFFPRFWTCVHATATSRTLTNFFSWNNFHIYASPLSLLVSEIQSVMNWLA